MVLNADSTIIQGPDFHPQLGMLLVARFAWRDDRFASIFFEDNACVDRWKHIWKPKPTWHLIPLLDKMTCQCAMIQG